MTVVPIRPDPAPAQAPTAHLNRRQTAKAATRAKALAAAWHLFLNSGYFDTSLRNIATRMGMSTGAVFANFQDKETLWREAVGGPAPDPRLAEELAILTALRADWDWLFRRKGTTFLAAISSPDYSPMNGRGVSYGGGGDTPAEAIRNARFAAERADGTFAGGPMPGTAPAADANAVRTPGAGA
tara:strand:+ start:20194 stop:20745 length:552 start_codon:yes stop_codon:yes gene_type:complete